MMFLRSLYDSIHHYSNSGTAPKKRAIDETIMGGSYANLGKVRFDDADYLRALIAASAHDRSKLTGSGKGLQFYIIRGGAEGFLSPFYLGKDASRVIEGGATTSGAAGTTMIFDDNDLICAFEPGGALVGAALLRRPISIRNPNIWSEHTANRVYNAWNGQRVSLYRNRNFDIPYYGLVVYDSLGLYHSGAVRIDIHKEEATNGCVFIKDPRTPPYSDTVALSVFEPKFITDVQASIGAKIKGSIGTMHMLWIK